MKKWTVVAAVLALGCAERFKVDRREAQPSYVGGALLAPGDVELFWIGSDGAPSSTVMGSYAAAVRS